MFICATARPELPASMAGYSPCAAARSNHLTDLKLLADAEFKFAAGSYSTAA
jgi:hypothetical protein